MPINSLPSFSAQLQAAGLQAGQATSLSDIFGQKTHEGGAFALVGELEKSKKADLSHEQITKAAKEFESVFLSQMLQSMIPEDSQEGGLFGNRQEDQIFRNKMMEEYANQIAKSGGIGIASHIEKELLGTQTNNNAPSSYSLPIGEKINAYEQAEELQNAQEKQLGETI